LAAIGIVGSATALQAQQYNIQPSPAYYQSGGSVSYPAPAPAPAAPAATATPAPAPVAPAAAPVYYAPPPAGTPVYYAPPPAGTPVYYAPPPGAVPVYYAAPPAAPAAVEAEEEEEGLYWFWGQKWPGLSIGAQIGTLGWGGDLVFGINRFLSLRSGVNTGSLGVALELDGVDYDTDINFFSVPLLIDLYPFGDHFRISTGAYIPNGTSMDLAATPDEAVQIGDHTYGPDVVGNLTGSVEVDSTFAYYLGIGFGNPVAEDQRLTVKLDLGVVFQSYEVELNSDGAGMTAKLDTFREDIVKEEANLQDDFDQLKVYPVITLGLALTF
jgi:hypothetical protein